MARNSKSRKNKRATEPPGSSLHAGSTASTNSSVPSPAPVARHSRRLTRSSMHVLRVGGGPYLSSRPRLPRKALAKSGNCAGSDSEDNEEEGDEEEEETESEIENGFSGDNEHMGDDYEEEERDDSDDKTGGETTSMSRDVNMDDTSNDPDPGSRTTDQNHESEQRNNREQAQGAPAAAVEDEIYYSDSDPEATIPDVYGVDSDDDGDGESGDVAANDDDAFPDLLPADTYHPEHPTVRQHIDELFQKTLTVSANPPINAPQLVDRLVRQHLPQFWRHRFQDIKLNQHKNTDCHNKRPRSLAILSMCVECGHKFCKQPLYDDSQRERHWRRWKRARATKRITGRKPPRKRKSLFGADYFHRRQGLSSVSSSGSDSGKCDNSELTAIELDNILNNNRRSLRYDGNLDHIGLKEEKHSDHCLHNQASAKLSTKKIYMGWGLVPGHDHPMTPRDHRGPLTSAASASSGITVTSLSSLPETSTPCADPLTEEELTSLLPESDCLLYPSRSLMASFCHLIPRGLVFSNNMLRKLFTYFVWHPWFDCHLQAITIRRAYSELWPIFLLRDEDAEVDDEEEAEFRRQMNAFTRTTRQAAHERRKLKLQAEPQTGSKRKSNDTTGTKTKKKTRLNDGTAANTKGKRKCKKSESHPVSDDDEPTPPVPKIRKPRTAEELLGFERSRLISLEARFTTSFNNGVSIHGICPMRMYPSMNTKVRLARQIRKGWTVYWTLPSSPTPGSIPSQPYVTDDDDDDDDDDDSGDNKHHGSDEKQLFARRKVHYYIVDIEEKYRTTASGIVHPETLFPELPEEAVLRLTNHPLTQPDRKDALSRLAARLSSWFRRAHRQRTRQGFVLPEYMKLRPPKAKPERKIKTQLKSKPKRKPAPKARDKTKTKANASSTLDISVVPESNPEVQAASVDPEGSIGAVELVNYLTQPWSDILAPCENSSSLSCEGSLGGVVRKQSPRGLNTARLDLQALDTSSLPLTTVSTTVQRDSLKARNVDSARQSALDDYDERQLYGLMFDDILDSPFDRSDPFGWSSGYGSDLAIPNVLMALDMGETDVDMGCFQDAQRVSDEQNDEDKGR
ncbi:hypothetical protein BGZ70_010681 [Mortierella alpina]|uniref:Uncharacterized protein n=1 Tax=Mortierella alpina TaxID=64518 RepID=A0A9P6LZ59_MORAP|nr:hypothetical protein BGZ70_010681 [Mortierella alpina]